MQKEHVCNALCEARKLKKLTQQELAEKSNVSRQTIISIEKGNYTPSVLLALKIARILSKNVEELFFIENNHE